MCRYTEAEPSQPQALTVCSFVLSDALLSAWLNVGRIHAGVAKPRALRVEVLRQDTPEAQSPANKVCFWR